jgi:hypothetical protein
MRKMFTKLLMVFLISIAAWNTHAQCDQSGYADLAGPCATSVCSYDPYCCATAWDSFCAAEAVTDENCQYCWVDCHDNDLDGYTNCEGDCDDFNAAIHPNATDVCGNSIDEDCDGVADNGTCDEAGYTNFSSPCGVSVCSYDSFCCSNSWDAFCAAEAASDPFCQFCWCGCYDNDLDGYTNCDGDCEDFNPFVHPGAEEICGNDVDDDCNGQIDEVVGFCDNAGYTDLAGACAVVVCANDAYCCNTTWDNICAGEAAALVDCQYCLCGCYDNDLDGYTNCENDCDDFNADVNPGIVEICGNNIDENCDGNIDNGSGTCDNTNYADLSSPCGTSVCDLDSYCCNTAWDCEGDCNDFDETINPGMPEICNGLDDNCNGFEDDGLVFNAYFLDNDNDGWGSLLLGTLCQAPVGAVTLDGDCDDNNNAVHPGMEEICGNELDDNCDGYNDNSLGNCDHVDYSDLSGPCATAVCDIDAFCCTLTWDAQCAAEAIATAECSYCLCGCYDNDLDGFTNCEGDCDDFNEEVNPSMSEICNNEIDDDCDGYIDNSIGSCDVVGYSDPGSPCTTSVCDQDPYCCNFAWDATCAAEAAAEPNCAFCLCGCYDNDLDTYTNCDGDCDDFNNAVYPGAAEICNEMDDDCNGIVDDNVVYADYYGDADGDGYGQEYLGYYCIAPLNSTTESGDCDDSNAAIHPNALEDCSNEIDENCDGIIDNTGINCDRYGYNQFDSPCAVSVCGYDPYCCIDTWDNICAGEAASDASCQECWCGCYDNDLDSYTNCDGDCDDFNADINPGMDEICNDIDDNCDGIVDEGLISLEYYEDLDGDGYGGESIGMHCIAPLGSVTAFGDCDDSDMNVNPGAMEICANGIDEDCDFTIDNLEGHCDSPGYAELDSPCALAVCDFDDYCCSGTWDFLCASTASAMAECAFCLCGCYDNDLDGVTNCDGDCDDFNADVYPGATEICNNIDDNCNGEMDENAPFTFYLDSDGDGYGNNDIAIEACFPPASYTADNTDCNDSNAMVHPNADESCNEEDDDCDGLIDEQLTYYTYYEDIDGDGFGSVSIGEFCSAPMDASIYDGDCDDSDAMIYPGQVEFCNTIDDNCDGEIDNNVADLDYFADNDADGFGSTFIGAFCLPQPNAVTNNLDCDDENADINPEAIEICDQIDDDCDGETDEGVVTTFYYDADGDGFGNIDATMTGCTADEGYVSDSSDCDDTDTAINPGMSEICNGVDDNCDGMIDDNAPFTFYADADGDSYGSPFITITACFAPNGYVSNNTDCDDSDQSVYPGANEYCNTVDDDCDGDVDDNVVYLDYYSDADGDGFGQTFIGNLCSPPSNSSTLDGDCDDANNDVNPSASEACNDYDDNCDGTVNEGILFSTYYADTDGDGFGAELLGDFCSAPDNSSEETGDCDDSDASVYPGANESCNGVDDDCNEAIDDNVTYSDYYLDLDGDGFGATFIGNLCTTPANSSLVDGDCDDDNVSINPDSSEICNLVDDNCDGSVDEGAILLTYYSDLDGDGFGADVLGDFCAAPANASLDNGDCDDTNSNVYPGASESCNSIDDDCNGLVDDNVVYSDYYQDTDGDGYGTTFLGNLCAPPSNSATIDGDCDDADAAVNPSATEVCNDVDDNCDSQTDEGLALIAYYTDIDGDGFGTDFLGDFCSAPSNASSAGGDCDDTNNSIYPGASEFCNDVDDDCDGTLDNDVVYLDYYSDLDNDGYGSTFIGNLCVPPANGVTNSSDCNDQIASTHPNAIEFCNNNDDDCDGQIDEGLNATPFYSDVDGDTFGGALLGSFCVQPANSSATPGDCNDNEASINPASSETCNSLDDDCDGDVDEGVLTSFYMDADGDTYGDMTSMVMACALPVGYASNSDDCDDTNSSVNPNAIEYCNGIDDDCNSAIDDNCIDNVEEIAGDWNVQLYPNPVNDQLNITLTGANGSIYYVIYDAVGKEVIKARLNSATGVNVINCAKLSQGSYTLKVYNNKMEVQTPFMKL